MRKQTMEIPKNRFRNNAKTVAIGMKSFQKARRAGVTDQFVRPAPNDRLVTREGHEFVNFSSCNYLGLHSHPKVIEGAANMVREQGFMWLAISVVRVCADVHRRLEEELSELFRANCLVTLSCSSASEGILPLLACGALTEGERPLMIFDKHSHFSMATVMPMCGDETDITSCQHNDLNFVEDMCRKHSRVVYVADGAYSMGGHTLMRELIQLQDRYGLFLYLDDSHSLSMYGPQGCGFVRSNMGETLNDLTVINCSLAKAFGASGGVVMLGPDKKKDELVRRFGGPLGWSQNQSTATLGAAFASAEIHRGPELVQLQKDLKDRLNYFDERVETPQSGNDFPIRMVKIGNEDDAVEVSSRLYKRGFYCSAVFFPIVAKGQAGIRVMLRANNRFEDLSALSKALKEVQAEVTGVTT